MTIQYSKNRPDLFWLVAGLIALAAILNSCSPNFYCKRCPSITKDSVTIIERDSVVITEVTDTVPADTLRDTVKVPCADFEYKKETTRQKVYIRVKDGEMTEEVICKEWEYKYKVQEHWHFLKERAVHYELRTAYEKKGRPNWWIWLLIGTGIGLFVPKILKAYLKIPWL